MKQAAATPAVSRATSSRRWKNWAQVLPLLTILIVGAGLRLCGMNWDGGHWLHPDERQIYFVTLDLSWPRSLEEALSPASPMNPRSFAYGSLPLYLLKLSAAVGAWLLPTWQDPDHLHLVGRSLAVLIDLGTVYLTYRLARILAGLGRTDHPVAQEVLGRSIRPEQPIPLPTMQESDHRTFSWRGRHRPDPIEASRPAPSREWWGQPHGSALLVAALLSLAILPVQEAHFYTADTLLTFLVALALNFGFRVAQSSNWRHRAALGISLGLALATKVSAMPLLVFAVAAHLVTTLEGTTHRSKDLPLKGSQARRGRLPTAQIRSRLGRMVGTLVVAGVTFVVVQPYAIIDWQTFLQDTVRESQIAWGRLDVPYTRQFAGTLPCVYSMGQTALWGLGLPLGLAGWLGLAAALVRWLRHGHWSDSLLLSWVGPYLIITGLLHARYLRYMLPVIPILCLMAVQLLTSSGGTRLRPADGDWRRLRLGGYLAVGLGSLAYAAAFATLFAQPHPWIAASEWIYRQIPAGSTLAVEDWDTPLPLPVEKDGVSHRIEQYKVQTLNLYDEPDDTQKWAGLASQLADSDYLIIASRRLYGSIPRQPDRYPITTSYYERLFAGELGFELVGAYTRGPACLNPRLELLGGITPRWLQPDESFVVYDHPRALIFHNSGRLSAETLLMRLSRAASLSRRDCARPSSVGAGAHRPGSRPAL